MRRKQPFPQGRSLAHRDSCCVCTSAVDIEASPLFRQFNSERMEKSPCVHQRAWLTVHHDRICPDCRTPWRGCWAASKLAQEHSAYRALHRAGAGSFQGFLAIGQEGLPRQTAEFACFLLAMAKAHECGPSEAQKPAGKSLRATQLSQFVRLMLASGMKKFITDRFGSLIRERSLRSFFCASSFCRKRKRGDRVACPARPCLVIPKPF